MEFDHEYFKPQNDEEKLIVKKVFESFGKFKTALVILSGISSFCSITVPLFYKTNQGLPVQSWYPFNIEVSPQYELAYVHQGLAMFFISGLNIFTDTLVAGVCTFVGLQCDLLCQRARNLAGDELKFVECVKHHYTILSFLETVNMVFGRVYFAQIFASTCAICMGLFLLTLADPSSFQFFFLIVYQLCIGNLLLVPCWFASEMTVKSQNIPKAAYECDWVNSSKIFKKKLLFFIHRSQKPIKLYALDYFEITVETFGKIVRTSLSYFAVLRNLTEEETT
ncbi:odorant receptor 46a-like [Sitophilus oryzae]|uniref:Odorant receptor 46a-like n=1 Tax=Sitophilus oryzae TaxID=7048 RepID=A0A6J2YKE5_SITOR|nr:odorant receptor 46a-like [Sitophilus oryzae]